MDIGWLGRRGWMDAKVGRRGWMTSGGLRCWTQRLDAKDGCIGLDTDVGQEVGRRGWEAEVRHGGWTQRLDT